MIPKRLLIDFASLKVGDKKHDILYGTITITEKTGLEYCIIGTDVRGTIHTYKKYGYRSPYSNVPSLYNSDPFELISEYPKEMLVSALFGDLIPSKNHDKRLIVHYNSKLNHQYIDENGNRWKFAKDIEPEPPTIEITMSEAIEELKKSEKYKNKNLTIK